MIASAALAAALPPAHDGHGRAEWHGSVLHWLLEPVHAIPIVIALAGALVLAFRLAKRAKVRAAGVGRPRS